MQLVTQGCDAEMLLSQILTFLTTRSGHRPMWTKGNRRLPRWGAEVKPGQQPWGRWAWGRIYLTPSSQVSCVSSSIPKQVFGKDRCLCTTCKCKANKQNRTAGLGKVFIFCTVKSRCDDSPAFMIIWGNMIYGKESWWLQRTNTAGSGFRELTWDAGHQALATPLTAHFQAISQGAGTSESINHNKI